MECGICGNLLESEICVNCQSAEGCNPKKRRKLSKVFADLELATLSAFLDSDANRLRIIGIKNRSLCANPHNRRITIRRWLKRVGVWVSDEYLVFPDGSRVFTN